MKNLLLVTLLLISIFFGANAQQALGVMSVSGQVLDSNGVGLVNYPVNLRNETFSSKTIFSNSSGWFSDTINVYGNGNVEVSILDCNNDSIVYNLPLHGTYDSVYVFFDYCGTGSSNCFGNISQNVNGLNANFTVIDNMAANTQYSWDIDGNAISGSSQSVSYSFSGPGTYPVCVTAVSSQCSYSICDIVTISAPQPGNLALGGHVFKGNTLAQDGIAFLFEVDSTITPGSVLNAVGFSTLDSGMYQFTGLPAGSYRALVLLQPNDPDWMNYFPTFYGNTVTWVSATDIVLNANSLQNDINMVPMAAAAPGPGIIQGTVVEGPNKNATGDPLEDIMVFLRDDAGTELEYKMTDANGEFRFDNVALGDYQLILEIPGVVTNPHNITIDMNQSSSSTAFEYDRLGVRVVLGISDEILDQKLRIFPNPAADEINVDLSNTDLKEVEIRIINLQGQEVYRNQIGGKTQKVDLNGFTEGVYFLKVNSGNGEVNRKFIKQ